MASRLSQLYESPACVMTPRITVPAFACRRAPMSSRRGITGLDAGAMAITVDFDECRELHSEGCAFLRQRIGGIHAVEQHRDVCAQSSQLRDWSILLGAMPTA